MENIGKIYNNNTFPVEHFSQFLLDYLAYPKKPIYKKLFGVYVSLSSTKNESWQHYYLSPLYDYLSLGPQYEIINQLIEATPEGICLDLGGGSGKLIDKLSGEGKLNASQVITCDLSISMLRQAQKKGISLLLNGNGYYLPLKNRSMDKVFLCLTIHHMKEYERALEEVSRVLRPGGRIVINDIDPRNLLGKLIDSFETLLGLRSTFFPPGVVKEALDNSGFTDINTIKKNHKYVLSAIREY